jgi:membrane protein required for colicin V production
LAIFDIVLLVFVALALLRGGRHGFILEISALLSIFLGLLIALKLTFPVAHHFLGASTGANILSLLIFLLLFLLTLWVSRWMSVKLKNAIGYTPLKYLDAILGALFAALKVLMLFSVMLWALTSLDMALPLAWVETSLSYPVVISLAPNAYDYVGEWIPFFADISESMTEPLPAD